MAFHRTAVLKRRYHSEHTPNHNVCNPDRAGQFPDPDPEVNAEEIPTDEPIHFVGNRLEVKRKRSPSPAYRSNAISKCKLDHQCSSQSSVCSPGAGRLDPDAYQTEITDEAGDNDLL